MSEIKYPVHEEENTLEEWGRISIYDAMGSILTGDQVNALLEERGRLRAENAAWLKWAAEVKKRIDELKAALGDGGVK